MRGSALLKTFGADDVIMLSFTDRVNSFKGWPFSGIIISVVYTI